MRKAARKELDFDLDYDDDAPADAARRPKRARISATRIGIFGLGALSLAIVVNAAFLQDQRRSAPLFKITLAEPDSKPVQPVQQTLPPLPPARVVEAPQTAAQPQPKIVPPEPPRVTAATSKVDLIAREISRGDPIAREIARTETPAPKAEKPAPVQKPQVEAKTEAKAAEKPRPAPARAEPRRNDAIAGLLEKSAPAQSSQSREAPSAEVRAAQRDLQRLGFVIAPSGVFDAATRKAIAQFERDANMPARGELTATVRRELSRRASGETQ